MTRVIKWPCNRFFSHSFYCIFVGNFQCCFQVILSVFEHFHIFCCTIWQILAFCSSVFLSFFCAISTFFPVCFFFSSIRPLPRLQTLNNSSLWFYQFCALLSCFHTIFIIFAVFFLTPLFLSLSLCCQNPVWHHLVS